MSEYRFIAVPRSAKLPDSISIISKRVITRGYKVCPGKPIKTLSPSSSGKITSREIDKCGFCSSPVPSPSFPPRSLRGTHERGPSVALPLNNFAPVARRYLRTAFGIPSKFRAPAHESWRPRRWLTEDSEALSDTRRPRGSLIQKGYYFHVRPR